MAGSLGEQAISSTSIIRGRFTSEHDIVGCFDEESCRYFLREVGSKVVPFYPFTFGMEEVYSLIVEEYGLAGIPDATSVLQDLLENERTAGGLGDDGDIWRSWRHSWRHRNDDSLNPFIPKISSFVLKPPTSPRTRIFKSENFLRTIDEQWYRDEALNQITAASDGTTTGQDPSGYSQFATLTCTHQRLRNAIDTTEGSHSQATRKHDSSGSNKAWSRSSSFRSSLFGRQSSTPLRAKASTKSFLKQSSSFAGSRPSDLNLNTSPSLTTEERRTVTFVPTIQFSSPRSPLVPLKERKRLDVINSEASNSFQAEEDLQPDSAMSLDQTQMDPSVLMAYETLTGQESFSAEQMPYLRGGGEADIAASVEINKSTTRCPTIPLPASLSLPTSDITTALRRVDNTTISDYSHIDFASMAGQSPEETSDSSPRNNHAAVISSPALSPGTNVHARNRDLHEEIPGANVLRAINREARLIDGQFCNPRIWKRLSSQPWELHDQNLVLEDVKPVSVRESWTSSKPKRDSRISLLRGIRGVFRKESLPDQQPSAVKTEEGEDQLQSRYTPSLPFRSNLISPGRVKKQKANHALGLDGAADDMSSPSISLSPDVNKALPLSPGELARALSQHKPLRGTSTDSQSRLSALFSVAGLHRSSSYRGSGDRSHYTLSQHRTSAPFSSPSRGRGPRHARTKTEPIRSFSARFSPISYSTIAYSNPFTSDKIDLSPVRPPSPLFARGGTQNAFPEPAASSAQKTDIECSPAANSAGAMYAWSPVPVRPTPDKPSVPAQNPIVWSPVSVGPTPDKPSVPAQNPIVWSPVSVGPTPEKPSVPTRNPFAWSPPPIGPTPNKPSVPAQYPFGWSPPPVEKPSMSAHGPYECSSSPVGPTREKPSVPVRGPNLEQSPAFKGPDTTHNYSPGPTTEKPTTPNTPKRSIKAFFGRSKSPSKRSISPTSRMIQPILMIAEQDTTKKDIQQSTPANSTASQAKGVFHIRLDERSIEGAPKNRAISLDPPSQNVLQADLDLMLVTSANDYLLRQATSQHLNADVVKLEKQKWAARGHSPVIDFQYDSTTQCSIVSTNITSLRFHGVPKENRLAFVKTVIAAWHNVTQLLSQRVYCHSDVSLRNLLHDASKVLDLLGAPEETILGFHDLQIRALAQMNRVRRLREEEA